MKVFEIVRLLCEETELHLYYVLEILPSHLTWL